MLPRNKKSLLFAAKNYFINFPVSIDLAIYPLQPEFLAFSSSPVRQMRLMPTSSKVGIVW
jgi:hypothetical protein